MAWSESIQPDEHVKKIHSKLDAVVTESAQKAFDNWVNKRYKK